MSEIAFVRHQFLNIATEVEKLVANFIQANPELDTHLVTLCLDNLSCLAFNSFKLAYGYSTVYGLNAFVQVYDKYNDRLLKAEFSSNIPLKDAVTACTQIPEWAVVDKTLAQFQTQIINVSDTSETGTNYLLHLAQQIKLIETNDQYLWFTKNEYQWYIISHLFTNENIALEVLFLCPSWTIPHIWLSNPSITETLKQGFFEELKSLTKTENKLLKILFLLHLIPSEELADFFREVVAIPDLSLKIKLPALENLILNGDANDADLFVDIIANTNESEYKRQEVAQLLMRLSCQQLINKIFYHADPEIRVIGVKTLGKLPDKHTMALMLRALSDPHPSVRAAVLETLSYLKINKLNPYFYEFLNDSEDEIRDAAVTALWRESSFRTAPFLVQRLQFEKKRQIYYNLLNALADNDSRFMEPRLFKFLANETNTDYQDAILRIISGSSETYPVIIQFLGSLLDSRDKNIDEDAVSFLQGMTDGRASGIFLEYLRLRPEGIYRKRAMWYLCFYGQRWETEKFIQLAEDLDDDSKQIAELCKARLQGDYNKLYESGLEEARTWLAENLWNQVYPEKLELLLKLVPQSKYKLAAMRSLGFLGDIRAFDVLVNALYFNSANVNEATMVRETAIYSLVLLGDKRAIAPLEDRLHHCIYNQEMEQIAGALKWLKSLPE